MNDNHFGRITYYEPTDASTKNRQGLDEDFIPFPYEDYSMAIDLTIEVYNRYSCGFSNKNNNKTTFRYSSSDGTLSFLNGTNGYLTTNYTDISMTNPSENTKECLGIESITVTYQSWLYPTVHIKFVDVRGGTVMQPAEQNYFDESKKGVSYNIYKAFFSFPYPLFKLKLKGFYGKGVTYRLTVNKVDIDFDSNNGNFIINVDFIGQMYGMFTDIPMTYLAIAPYLPEGKVHWDSMINSQKFWFKERGEDGGVIPRLPMMTFVELAKKINDAIGSSETLTQEEQQEMYRKEAAITGLDTVISNYNALFNNEKLIKSGANGIFEDDKYTYFIPANGTEFEKLNDSYTKLAESVREYNKVNSGKIFDFVINKNLDATNKDTYETQLYDRFYQYGFEKNLTNTVETQDGEINAYLYTVDSKSAYILYIVMNGAYQTTDPNKTNSGEKSNPVDKSSDLSEDEKERILKIFTKELDGNDGDILCCIQRSSDTAQKFKEAFEAVNSLKTELTNENNKEQEELNQKRLNQSIENALGFKPTIKNIYDLVFAHMDTFMHVYYEKLRLIQSDLSGNIRDKSVFTDVDEKDTDTARTIDNTNNTNMQKYPPFTAFYKRTDDNRATVLRWPGELQNHENLVEVDFIEELVKAVRDYTEEAKAYLESLSAENTNSVSVSRFIPLSPYDFANFQEMSNPYSYILDSDQNSSETELLDKLFFTLAMRIFYIGAQAQDNIKNKTYESLYGQVEAINFYKAIGDKALVTTSGLFNLVKNLIDNKTTEDSFIDALIATSGHEWNNVDNTSPTFYNFLYRKYGGNSIEYKYQSPNPTVTDVITNQYIPVGDFTLETLKNVYTERSFNKRSDFIRIPNSKEILETDENVEEGKPLEGGTFFIKKSNSYFDDIINAIESELSIDSEKDDYLHRSSSEYDTYKDFLSEYKKNLETLKIQDCYYNDCFYDADNQKETADITGKEDFSNFYVKYPTEYNAEQNSSLFDKSIYTSQTDEENGIYVKACLFLQAIPMKLYANNVAHTSLAKYNNCTMPKSALLREGSLLWWKKNSTKVVIPEGIISPFKDDFKKCFLVQGEWFDRDLYKFNAYPTSVNKGFDFYQTCNDVLKTSKSRQEYLLKYFTQWVESEFKINEPNLINKNLYTDNEFGKGLNLDYLKGFDINGESDVNKAKDLQSFLKSVFFDFYAVFEYNRKNENYNSNVTGEPILLMDSRIEINQMKYSFEGFCKGLKAIYGPLYNDAENNPNEFYERTKEAQDFDYFANKDVKLSTYMTMKNLYDKWICASEFGEQTWRFTGEDFLKGDIDTTNGGYRRDKRTSELDHFLYLDNFYNNIGYDLPINTTKIQEWLTNYCMPSAGSAINEATMFYNGRSVYEFLADVAQDCGGILLALPQCSMFNDSSFIERAFKPYAITNDWDEDSSAYIFLYTYKPSEHLGTTNPNMDMNGYCPEGDGFNITEREVSEGLFKETGWAYKVPAFGITFAKDNQSYFKKIGLSTTTHSVTEVSINATMNIAAKADEASKETTLYGQDIYKILGNYSYECTVEMLGDMQIFPLMYFQLNNIPLWKGAYLIQKVSHNIAPGEFTTTIVGVRQNKYAIPLSDTKLSLASSVGGSSNGKKGVKQEGEYDATYYDKNDITFNHEPIDMKALLAQFKNMNLTRGYRNNNPLNINQTSSIWKDYGEIPRNSNTDWRFKQFTTLEGGYAAAFYQMCLYYYRDGIKTIKEIVYKWAPPKENRTVGYYTYVARNVFTDNASDEEKSNRPLTFNAETFKSIAYYMTIKEVGGTPDKEAIAKGWEYFKNCGHGGKQ